MHVTGFTYNIVTRMFDGAALIFMRLNLKVYLWILCILVWEAYKLTAHAFMYMSLNFDLEYSWQVILFPPVYTVHVFNLNSVYIVNIINTC